MTKAQSETGKVHVIKGHAHGFGILLCDGRAVSFMLLAADNDHISCKSCAKKVTEMGGIPE